MNSTSLRYERLAKKHSTIGKVIEECADYEEIGTAEEFKKLKEKNTPKKPIKTDDCTICEKEDCTKDCLSFRYGFSVPVCPNCKGVVVQNRDNGDAYTYKHCPECGQAIDWN